MAGHNEKEKEMVRKLRVEEKKSFGEIARITGIAKTTIIDWARKESWPSPSKEQKKLAEVINIKKYKCPNHSHAQTNKQQEVTELVKPPIDGIDFKSKPQQLAQQLFKWSAQVMLDASQYSLQAVKAIMDTSAKMLIAYKNDTQEEQRKLTVYVPTITEVYEDPPEEYNQPTENPK